MKAKVITYKQDGNTICQKYMELEQLSDHVFIHRLDGDVISTIFNVQGVYVEFLSYSRYAIAKLHLQNYEDLATNFVKYVNQGAERGEFIFNTYIEVFRQLGLDTQPLEASSRAYTERLERERIEEAKKREQKERERKEYEAQQREQRLNTARQKYIDGEFIDPRDFVLLAEKAGLTIHPRTKNAFKYVCFVRKDTMVRRYESFKKRKLDGIFDTIKRYNQTLN